MTYSYPLIIFPEELWTTSRNKIASSSKEIGFYLIGTRWRDRYLIYDLVEFNYKIQSTTFLEGNALSKILLINSILPVLSLIGTLHSHPFISESKGLFPSAIDIENLRNQHKDLLVLSSKNGAIRSFYFENHTLVELKTLIRPLKEEELPKIIWINGLRVIIPSGMSKWELNMYVIPKFADFLYNVYFNQSKLEIKTKDSYNLKIKPYIYLVRENSPFQIPYILFFEKSTSIKDLLNKITLIFSSARPKVKYKESYIDADTLVVNFSGEVLFL
ncbi:MAG: hypothetical protein ACTSVW_03140 [Candidatus Njordarchaeales archaeon]